MMATIRASEVPCVFAFEADLDQPCWGEIDPWGDTDEGDVIHACYGHYDWSLTVPHEENRKRYLVQK